MSEREEERWRQVDAVFARALARPESDRDAFLAAECEGDPWLARVVGHLIDAVGESDAFWDDAGRLRRVALREALAAARPDPARRDGAGA